MISNKHQWYGEKTLFRDKLSWGDKMSTLISVRAQPFKAVICPQAKMESLVSTL